MAYTTGSAATFAALKTALLDACTADGWTWDAGNEVLHKGTNYLKVSTPTISGGDALTILGRTSLTAGDGLNVCQLGPILGTPLVFPVTYHAFTFTNEVYFVVSSGDEYQWLAFGESTQPGLPGTGMFYAGSLPSYLGGVGMQETGGYNSFHNCPALFWSQLYGYESYRNWFVHNDLDGGGWGWGVGGSTTLGINYIAELIRSQPNAYNMESILLPVKAFNSRLDSKFSQVLECVNVRHIINTHYQNEEIITLGTDKWMVFPYFKKDPAYDSNSLVIGSSGVYGMAIRYEGP